MIDTPELVQEKQKEIFLKKSAEERAALGMEMIAFGYTILKERIIRENPMFSKTEIVAEIFRQLYKNVLPIKEIEKIALAIKDKNV